jgi:phosphoribosylformylglycinamidine synthase
MHGLIRGEPPRLDLEKEAALQRVLVDAAAAGLVRSAHDCSEGGLAVALAECCFDSGFGVDVDLTPVASVQGFTDAATLFGESATRVVVSTTSEGAAPLLALASAAGLAAVQIGTVGGDRIRLAVDGRLVVDEPVRDAEEVWSTALERYFERSRAIA